MCLSDPWGHCPARPMSSHIKRSLFRHQRRPTTSVGKCMYQSLARYVTTSERALSAPIPRYSDRMHTSQISLGVTFMSVTPVDLQARVERIRRPTLTTSKRAHLPRLTNVQENGTYSWTNISSFRDTQKCIFDKIGGAKTCSQR